MAAKIHAAQKFNAVQIFKDQSLGLGSYGAVYRAKADRLPCAAKLLHPILFQDGDPGARRIQQHFEQECQFLDSIRHPSIVQFLGTCRDHESGLPVLLMELMDESLTHFLENSPEPLSYHLEVNFSYDVALALDYLHSHGIVHRDLSSNNVLLIAGSRAKVTDFGMSKLLDTALHATSQTQCPGTMAYMSPEALRTPPAYNKKLDCFSFGVLSIQIMTRQFPDPGPARHVVENPQYPTGAIEVPVPERDRRKEHINLIAPNHPCLLLALRCLEYYERDRPSAQELCDQLATLKEEPRYTQSVQQARERGRGGRHATADITAGDQSIAQLQGTLAARDTKIRSLQQQLHEKEAAVTAMNAQNQQLQQDLTKLTHEKAQTIEGHDRQLRELNDQLQTNEQVTAEFQQNLLQKERRIRHLEEDISARDESNRVIREQLYSMQQLQRRRSVSKKTPDSTELEWKENQPPPKLMERNSGSAVVDGDVVYVRYAAKIFAYGSRMDSWKTMPDCPNDMSSLTVVNGLLTAVGGEQSGKVTDTLVSLTGEGGQRKWSEHFPPMPTKRSKPAVVCSEQSLVAAGGTGEMGEKLNKVEIMDTGSCQWVVVSTLPHPVNEASTTVCGDRVYILGGTEENGPTRCVYVASLTDLVTSQSQTLGRRLKRVLSVEGHRIWQRVADLPVYRSTCVTLGGHLLAVGGYESNYADSNAVYKYNPAKNTWDIISCMPRAFSFPLVAPLPGNKMVVCRDKFVYTASVVKL